MRLTSSLCYELKVHSKSLNEATQPNCGKLLRTLTTTLFRKLYKGTRLIIGANGNKVKDWTIRSQASKSGSGTSYVFVETVRYDKDMRKVQRLDDCGLEKFNQL